MRRVCFLLLWYHYGLHQLGLFSYGLYVILCIRERVLCVLVQDCQNGGEFARHHLMYLRSPFAFENNNNYHPIIIITIFFYQPVFHLHTPRYRLVGNLSFWFAFVLFGGVLVSLVAWW